MRRANRNSTTRRTSFARNTAWSDFEQIRTGSSRRALTAAESRRGETYKIKSFADLLRQPRPGSNTPARCIRKLSVAGRVLVLSAECHSNHLRSQGKK